jgi:small neutral amino acid transporter SnatA (MarC family)
MGGSTEMKRLAIIITLSLVAAALLCWFTLTVATTIARLETSKTEHIEKEIDE